MEIGSRVKYSSAGLRHDWERYLAQGNYSKKQETREYYETRKAERGTVLEINTNPNWYRIKWDNSSESKTANYLIEIDK